MQDKFKKTEAQKNAIKLLASPAKHVALGGGSRSGKSFILMFALIVRACKVKSRHCVFRLNFNHVKRSIVMETMPKVMSLAFPNLKYELNKTDYILTLPNQSQIFFAGLDSGDRVEKVLGQEFSTLWFNEISQIPYSSVQMALTRLAEKNTLAKKVYYDLNPNTKASWAYSLFIKKLDPIENTPLIKPDDYAYLRMNPSENLENIDSEYLALLESMPELEKNRFLLGEFGDHSDGICYYAFKRDEHVKEVSRRDGTFFIGMDFNWQPFCAALYQIIDGKFCFFDEVYLENADTYRMCEELKKRGYAGGRIVPDSTGRNRRTSGKSDHEILRENGFFIESTYNPFVTDRVNNANRLFTAGRVLIHPKCRKLIGDFEKVSWKDNKIDQSGASKMLSHISDAATYGLWFHDPIAPAKKLAITTSER